MFVVFRFASTVLFTRSTTFTLAFSIPAISLLLPILYDKSTAKGRYGRRSRRVEPVQLRDMV